MRATFVLFVPALGYRYALFNVAYPPLGYPAVVRWNDGGYPVDSEQGLTTVLSNILQSEPTRRMVATLKQRAADGSSAA